MADFQSPPSPSPLLPNDLVPFGTTLGQEEARPDPSAPSAHLAEYRAACAELFIRENAHVANHFAGRGVLGDVAKLTFAKNYIGPLGAVALARVLRHFTALQALLLPMNGLTSEMIVALMAAVNQHPTLRNGYVDLSDNKHLTPVAGLEILLCVQKNPSLIVKVGGTSISASVAREIDALCAPRRLPPAMADTTDVTPSVSEVLNGLHTLFESLLAEYGRGGMLQAKHVGHGLLWKRNEGLILQGKQPSEELDPAELSRALQRLGGDPNKSIDWVRFLVLCSSDTALIDDVVYKTVRREFERYDTNKDGSISWIELRNMVSGMMGGSVPTDAFVKSLMEQTGIRGTGKIVFDEFVFSLLPWFEGQALQERYAQLATEEVRTWAAARAHAAANLRKTYAQHNGA